MPVRDLTVLFQIVDKVSSIMNPILDKVDSVDGTDIEIGINMDPGQAAAQASAFQSSLDNIQGAGEKLTDTLQKVTNTEQAEGKAAGEAGKKTKESGEAAKQASTHFQTLKNSVEHASNKMQNLKDHLDGVKGKLLAAQAALVGFTAISVLSSAKNERLTEELKGVMGPESQEYLAWADQGQGKAYTTKSQRLSMAVDLSSLNYDSKETKGYAEEIEKFFFQRTAQMQRYGISSAQELAKAFASAEKGGETEAIKKLFSSGAISANSLDKEVTRLRTNYEKFASATEDVVKKQAMHNIIMKELTKTNQGFTGEATTLEQKLDVLGTKWNSFLTGIGDKLRPVATSLVDALIKVLDTIESIPNHDEIFIFIGLLIAAITTLISWVFILAPALEFLSWLLGASGVGGAAAALGGFITSLGGILTTLAGVVSWVAGGIGALLAGLAAIPSLPIIAAILAIAAALYLVYTKTTILQEGFATVKEYIGRALAAAYKIFSTVTGGLRGNKSDLKDIGDWIKDWLDGLIPNWLSDIFATARSYYREALKWFDEIMGWWNSFLKKVGEVYDKVKALFDLGGGEEGEQTVTPEMQKYGVLGYGTINDEKAVKLAYRELAGDIRPNDPIYDQIKEATGGKTRLYGKDYNDLLQSHPELAAKFTKTGETLIKADEVGYYGVPDSALPPEEDSSPLALPDIPAAVEERVQEAGDTYVEDSAKNYEEKKAETGSETVAAMSSYDPIGFYKNLIFGSGEEKTGEGEGEGEKLPAGAVGATVEGSGAMIVHEDEELVPARITSGAGKLASLLGAALDFMSGRSDIEKEITERMTSQQTSSREISAGFGPVTVHVSIQAPVTVQITKEMDLSKLDVSRLIDWSKVSYELEKVVKATFRTQEG